MAYLDAATDRLRDENRARFTELVDAVRAGWIFGHDQKQYERWRSEADRQADLRPSGRPLSQLARDLGFVVRGVEVVRGEFEFRDNEPIQ